MGLSIDPSRMERYGSQSDSSAPVDVRRCPSCGTLNPASDEYCGSCGACLDPGREEGAAPAVVILLALGGMLMFFSFFFWLIAGITGLGLWVPALIMTIVASMMILAGIVILRRTKVADEREEQEMIERGRCQYCGGLNPPNATKCQYCGAPL